MQEHNDPVTAAKHLGYYANEGPEAVAARLMRHPEVTALLAGDKDSGAEMLSENDALKQLVKIINNADSDKDRMAALSLYMKATGMLDERIKVTSESSVSELDLTKYTPEQLAELEALLSLGTRT